MEHPFIINTINGSNCRGGHQLQVSYEILLIKKSLDSQTPE